MIILCQKEEEYYKFVYRKSKHYINILTANTAYWMHDDWEIQCQTTREKQIWAQKRELGGLKLR